jgi:hypothetical protein
MSGAHPLSQRASLTAVTPLLADDNWGNLMAVVPKGTHPAGGGVYYHVDCEWGVLAGPDGRRRDM